MSTPRTDRPTVPTTLIPTARRGSRSRVCAAAGGAVAQLAVISLPSGDALLAMLLGLLNESEDLDRTLQASLDLMTTALGGRSGEIWLRSGDARQVELH